MRNHCDHLLCLWLSTRSINLPFVARQPPSPGNRATERASWEHYRQINGP